GQYADGMNLYQYERSATTDLELLNIPDRIMKSTPANHRAAEAHECLVDVIALVEAGAQATELVEQSDRLLDHVAEDSQSAAVRFAASCDRGGDAAAGKNHASVVVVVSAIAHNLLRLAQRSADLALDRWDGVDQRNQLRHVVTVGRRERGRQRNSARIDGQVVLGPVLPAIHGARSRFF